jgi:hypothetical protein
MVKGAASVRTQMLLLLTVTSCVQVTVLAEIVQALNGVPTKLAGVLALIV